MFACLPCRSLVTVLAPTARLEGPLQAALRASRPILEVLRLLDAVTNAAHGGAVLAAQLRLPGEVAAVLATAGSLLVAAGTSRLVSLAAPAGRVALQQQRGTGASNAAFLTVAHLAEALLQLERAVLRSGEAQHAAAHWALLSDTLAPRSLLPFLSAMERALASVPAGQAGK